MKSVCVFTGSSFGDKETYEKSAIQLGQELAKRDLKLVYGGASVGLMGAVAEGALSRGGQVFGVLPESLSKLEIAHQGITELRIVDSMHARKTTMAGASDAFIALPGGLGTLEEMFEVWTWTQLGIHSKPIGLLNVDGYFNSLLEFLDHSVSSKFVKPSHRNILHVDDDAVTLLDILENANVAYEAKWIGRNKP